MPSSWRGHRPRWRPTRSELAWLALAWAAAGVALAYALALYLGAVIMRPKTLRLALVAAAAAAALGMAACATANLQTAEAVLRGAGMTVDAYCTLTPEGRADLRDRLNLPHLIHCPGD